MTIPADILAADKAGRIPDGISLSYLAQSRDYSAIVGILFMVCFTGVLTILRLYARVFLIKKVGLDDWLTILTWVCTLLNRSAFLSVPAHSMQFRFETLQ
jgi:hypothetical protein